MDVKSMERYRRQLVLDGFGLEGQERLSRGRALIVGLGGLGSPSAMYLAAAGVGTIVLMDDDAVSLSNFNRQILFATDELDRPKTLMAQQRLNRFNPDIKVNTWHERLEDTTDPGVFADFDVVLDCLDNLPSRLLLNRFCLGAKTPLVHGGVIRFYGQLMTIIPFEGPCLRCISPGSSFACDCEKAGVLGPVAGVIGVMQALEAIKVLADKGQKMTGRLLVFDGLRGTFEEVAVDRNPACPDCGEFSTGLASALGNNGKPLTANKNSLKI